MNATRIVEWSRRGGVRRRKLAQVILVLLFSFDLPPDVKVGEGVTFLHNCLGTVISPVVELRDGCMVYQNVTIGDAEMYRGGVSSRKATKVVIGEGASICCGAKVLGRDGKLVVGKGTVVGANAVLLESTGDNEVWVGAPARCVRRRAHNDEMAG